MSVWQRPWRKTRTAAIQRVLKSAPGPRGALPAPLGTLPALWIGALIIAAQLPQLAAVPGWVGALGLGLVALRLALLLRDHRMRRAHPARVPTWALVLCAVGIAVGVRASFGYLLGREPCIALLYALAGLKYLEARSPRDGAVLVCLASFLLITPFFASQSLLAAAAALPAVLLVGASLDVLATPTQATTSTRPPIAVPLGASPESPAAPWHRPLARSARLLVLGVPLAAVLFLFFPRLAAPLWGLPSDHAGRTGLSDRMSPGSISELSLSDAVAFRVDFAATVPAPPQRYWRGPVLSRFDGREWSLSIARPDGRLVPVTSAATTVDYTVSLEPHQSPWLFALDLPSTLPVADTITPTGTVAGSDGAPAGVATGTSPGAPAGVATGASPVAALTRQQQLLAPSPVTRPLRYRQQSVLRDRYPADTIAEARENLRLPVSGPNLSPRARAWASALRAQIPDDSAFIGAVLAWFNREAFVYTLAPPLLEDDPVDGFLFDTRRGFCEHFAGAFVFVLRAAGIPARVVTGYQGGEVNPRGGYMIVRQSDAHAWAEALIDGEWRRFDPTAAVAPSRIEMGLGGALPASSDVPILARLDGSWLKTVQLAWDALNHDWRRQVVGFNRERQQSLLRDVGLDRWAGWQYAAGLAGVALAWVGVVLGMLAWQRGRRDRVVRLWRRLCTRLARAGLPRLPHEGPLAYTDRAATRWPQLSAELREVGAAYAALRYGPEATGNDATGGDTAGSRAMALRRLERGVASLPRAAQLRAALRPAQAGT